MKKYSGYAIYIVHVEVVIAKLLSKRKGLQVWVWVFSGFFGLVFSFTEKHSDSRIN